MLGNHVGQHLPGLVLIGRSAQTTPAPGNLLPDQDAQPVAEVQDDLRLLIMPQANEIDTHRFHEFHLLHHQIFRHGGPESGMVLVPVRPAEQQAPSVQQEGTVIDEGETAEAEGLPGPASLPVGGNAHFTGIKVRILHIPEPGLLERDIQQFPVPVQVQILESLLQHRLAGGILDRDGHIGGRKVFRIVETGFQFQMPGLPFVVQGRLDLQLADRDGRHIDQVQIAVEAAINIEIRQVRGNHLRVARIIAADHERDFPFEACGIRTRQEGLHGIRDIDIPTVISARMRPYLRREDIYLGPLSGPFEFQDRPPILVGIVYGKGRPIPGRSFIISHIRIDAVFGVVAMRQGDVRPFGDSFRSPGLKGAHRLPDAAQIRPDELPAFVQACFVRRRDLGRQAGSSCEKQEAKEGEE